MKEVVGHMAILLQTLLRRLPAYWGRLSGTLSTPRIRVTGIAEDSRRVQPGAVFVAHGGRDGDGHRYIAAALKAGAVAVVGELAREEIEALGGSRLPYWQVLNGRDAFALLSAAFYNFPSQRMLIIGVTGTDGKTTTSTLIHSILVAHGIRTGLITTIAARIDDQEMDTGFHTTTPEAFDLQGYLAQMAQAKCKAVVLETTSHALDQARVAYVDYDIAVVTNVTHEHLDWHGTWDRYMQAKARLFQMLETSRRKSGIPKIAVLNLTDQSYQILSALPSDRTITYAVGADVDAMVKARDIVVTRDGTLFHVTTPAGERDTRIALIGAYNVENALAACATGLALDIALGEIERGLAAVSRVKGRMEFVHRGAFDVIVDFAHTPNALAQTINTVRMLIGSAAQGRVILVFGSAGLRDVQKRRLMGEVAAEADVAVLTAEDPRTEDPDAIIAEIASGLLSRGRSEGRDFLREPDRARAIDTAIGLARPGDCIVCCGKAHERSMAYGVVETPWDEFGAIRAALARHDIEPLREMSSARLQSS